MTLPVRTQPAVVREMVEAMYSDHLQLPDRVDAAHGMKICGSNIAPSIWFA